MKDVSFRIKLDLISIPLSYKFNSLTYKGYNLYHTPKDLGTIVHSAIVITKEENKEIKLKGSEETVLILKSEEFNEI